MVIGWDSSDFDLILPWIQDGDMSNLKQVMEKGRWHKLKSIYPPVTASAWSTIITGKNPGKHGISEFMEFKEKSYDAYPINASNRHAKDLWEILSDHGKKVVVIGVPVTFPVRYVNGCMVSGFLTPNDTVCYSYPEEIKEELKSNIPGYSVNPSDIYDNAISDDDIYIRSLFDTLDKHIAAAIYLAKTKEWDFFMSVFNETDWVQHRFWHTLDPNHQKYSSEAAKKYGNVIRDVHLKLDKALGKLMEISGTDVNLMILSDHGVGPLYKVINTNYLLWQIGKLKFKDKLGTKARLSISKVGFRPSQLHKLMGIFSKRLLNNSTKTNDHENTNNETNGNNNDNNRTFNLAKKIFLTHHDIDWTKTEAFAPFGSGQIFINKYGKFPCGIVKDNYELVRQEIVNSIKDLNVDGKQIIDKVFLKEDIFDGEYSEKCPDIQFQAVRGYFPIGSLSHGMTSLLEKHHVSGTHSMEGIIVLKETAADQNYVMPPFGDVNLIDIAPTILHLMNLPIPSDMDGRSILEQSKGAPKIVNEEITQSSNSIEQVGYTKEEQNDIEDRLRSLGYI
jgi:predicted AlkP superfamily phosphohydrolase/phosphomutase